MNNSNKKLKNNNQNQAIDGGFLQSKYWQKFQESIGNKVFRQSCTDGSFLAVTQELPLGLDYFLVPRGPIISVNSESAKVQPLQRSVASNAEVGTLHDKNKQTIDSLIDLAKQEKVGWVKIETQTEDDLELIKKEVEKINKEGGGNYEVVKSKKEHQPKQTLMVDLVLDEEEIIKSFKSKTRYNIRLSKRKGVEVIVAKGKEEIEKFLDLLEETAERDGIKNYPRKHYRKLIALRSQTDADLTQTDADKIGKSKSAKAQSLHNVGVKLYLAKHEDDILAGAIVTYAGEIATYLHGASSNKKRNLMAPFRLHWEIMKQAKESGYKKYDLGGTKLVKNSKKNNLSSGSTTGFPVVEPLERWTLADGSWQGITRFKLGFCPKCQPTEFPGGYDIVINKWKYRVYRFIQRIKS